MTSTDVKAFIDAMEAAGITNYHFVDGFETIFYNNDNSSVLIPDYGKEVLISVSATIGGRKGTMDNNPFTIIYVPFETLAEARVGIPNVVSLKEALSELGITLDDEQFQKVAKAGFRMSFVTADYNFKVLAAEEYEALTEEEKAVYDEELKKYNNKLNGVSQGGASINTGGWPVMKD